MLSDTQKKSLLNYARDVISAHLDGSQAKAPSYDEFEQKKGIFVSLHKDGKLRGCIGYIRPYKSILESVREMALAAAFRDPRFSPVRRDELDLIEIEISILGELIPVEEASEILIGRDGLYIDHPQGSGLLLPQVATEYKWNVPEFLHNLCHKAGLRESALKSPDTKLYRFEAEIFSSSDIS
jgi:AmmeMemoRadiSam system protein A